MKYGELISQMTLEEKASLCSGLDFWHLKGIERLGIPSILVTDGPHGIRKATEAGGDVNNSVPSTCFPTASATAASWDLELIKEVGEAIAEEALQEDVAVVLGPGTNIKRSPLCGRNFEYFSEDPILAGEMSAAFIEGVQSKGVGTSLKHYCCNNQESRRMTIDAIVDERAMREIYLKPFEIAVKKSKPYTLMCSYNKINGTYASENKYTLTDILRDEWGFDGIVMSDWGAVNKRPLGLAAGLDLEMPSSAGVNDALIVKAVKEGKLDESVLDKRVGDLLELIFKCAGNAEKGYKYDKDAHDALARRAAAESAVLLKNQDILPVRREEKVLVIGELAEKPRYQGAGSSHICPHRLTSLLDALREGGYEFDYARGYNAANSGKVYGSLVKEAVTKATRYDKVIIVAGLTDEYEAEGFDRKNLDMPAAHNALIDEVAKVNENVIVAIAAGAPVLMPWAQKVKAILYGYLGGQASGGALADIIFGKVNPSGKLAETFPLSLEDTPSYSNFPGDHHQVRYAESLYVGYRYYDKAGVNVLYPFGYGISYTTFGYDNARADADMLSAGGSVRISVDVTNKGNVDGKEIVQLYVGKKDGGFRPVKELKSFRKVFVKAGETVTVDFELAYDDLAIYDIENKKWTVESGEYDFLLAKSSDDGGNTVSVRVEDGCNATYDREKLPWYFAPDGNNVPIEQFETLYGKKMPISPAFPKKGEFTTDNCFADMEPNSWLARRVSGVAKFAIRKMMKVKKKDPGLLMMHETFRQSPIRGLESTSQGMVSSNGTQGIITILNGHFFRGLSAVLKDIRRKN